MKMWTVFRDQRDHCRMYWVGNGDFSGSATGAAGWQDRRDAFSVADELLDCYPGPVDAPYTYGEECVEVGASADPKQIIPSYYRGKRDHMHV